MSGGVTRYRPRIPPGATTQDQRVPFDSGTLGQLIESALLRFSQSVPALAIGGDPANLGQPGLLVQDETNPALSLQNLASTFFTFLFAQATAAGLTLQANPGVREVAGGVQLSNNADGNGVTFFAGDTGAAVGSARISIVPGIGITIRAGNGGAETLYWTIDQSGNINNQTAAYIELLPLAADPAAPAAGAGVRVYSKNIAGLSSLFYRNGTAVVGPLT